MPREKFKHTHEKSLKEEATAVIMCDLELFCSANPELILIVVRGRRIVKRGGQTLGQACVSFVNSEGNRNLLIGYHYRYCKVNNPRSHGIYIRVLPVNGQMPLGFNPVFGVVRAR